ncbi:unnamed protein product [Macrosiphum euphorbiae]|uniref:Uncharacterized protein n=1 Tax=Macrosiphum euphorbiae TaxID=13131 RepID=A0AAV0W327_9HEMI|nr:unnamed protein product [Macrosiphum euphorbiae]
MSFPRPLHRLRLAGRCSLFFSSRGIENPLKADVSLCSVYNIVKRKKAKTKIPKKIWFLGQRIMILLLFETFRMRDCIIHYVMRQDYNSCRRRRRRHH